MGKNRECYISSKRYSKPRTMVRETKEISLGFGLLLSCVEHWRYNSQST